MSGYPAAALEIIPTYPAPCPRCGEVLLYYRVSNVVTNIGALYDAFDAAKAKHRCVRGSAGPDQ